LDKHGSFTEKYDQGLIDPKGFTLHHLPGSESGGGPLPLGSLPLPDPQSENEHGGKETKKS